MVGSHLKSLRQLFQEIPVNVIYPLIIPDIQISGIAYDSRTIQEGEVFIALKGGNLDGHRFIPTALERGAAVIIGTNKWEDVSGYSHQSFNYIQVDDTRYTMAHLSAALYNFPAQKMSIVGVTGTDGKTTTTNLIFNILNSAGLKAGMISTVNAMIGNDEVIDTGFHVTTPEAIDVQRYLARMVDAGCTHAVLETTSHGLAQHRVTGCEFDIGVITNITHEHLDYHHTYEDYRAAKSRLLTELVNTGQKKRGNPRLAVLNHDDQSFDYLQKLVSEHHVAYSLAPGCADVFAEDVSYDVGGLNFTAVIKHSDHDIIRFPVYSSLIGTYNVSNCLAAITATILGFGISPDAVRQGIAAMSGIPGRMECIDMGQDFIAIVDFAHTPNALRRVLETVRPMTMNRIFAIYGSAGLRDRVKRRLMPEISTRLADVTVFTAEDPRTEALDEILAEMASSAMNCGGVEGKTYWCIADRGEAINFSINMAQPGDLVIACGKGHEQSMCFGETEFPWDDRIAMRAALAKRLGITGPEMPVLPTTKL